MKRNREAKRQLDKTIALTTGVIGIGVADVAAGSIPTPMTQTIVRKAVIPTAATSLMELAGGSKKRRKK